MKKLYVIPTPIGNIDEISDRAKYILSITDVLLCEDTRSTKKLLNLLKIKIFGKTLISLNKDNEKNKLKSILNLCENKDLALVSNAGAPTINDPGAHLIKAAITQDIKVIPLSGPCSLVNVLMASGIITSTFSYIGFIPKKQNEIKQIFETKTISNGVFVFLVSVYQVEKFLQFLIKNYPSANLVLGRELTKLHETFYYGSPNEVKEKLKVIKGEFCGVIQLKKEKEKNYTKEISALKQMNLKDKQIVNILKLLKIEVNSNVIKKDLKKIDKI